MAMKLKGPDKHIDQEGNERDRQHHQQIDKPPFNPARFPGLAQRHPEVENPQGSGHTAQRFKRDGMRHRQARTSYTRIRPGKTGKDAPLPSPHPV